MNILPSATGISILQVRELLKTFHKHLRPCHITRVHNVLFWNTMSQFIFVVAVFFQTFNILVGSF